MLEIDTTRHNPLIDPHLAVWSWEIPVYLFVGGIVAGMMVLAGVAMLRIARGDDSRTFFSAQTPLLGFILMNVGMLALLLDLTHRLYVWRIYTTFQWTSPMSWGSWVLIVVYGVLLVSALIRLPDAWPWLGRTVPLLETLSDTIVARPPWIAALGWANIVLGIGLGIYTGILLNTMVARPLVEQRHPRPAVPVLGPFRRCGGDAPGLGGAARPADPAGHGRRRLLGACCSQSGAQPPEKRTVDSLIRFDQLFLAIELVLIALLILNLQTSIGLACGSGGAHRERPLCPALLGRRGGRRRAAAARLASPRAVAPRRPHGGAGPAGAGRRLHAALGHGQCRAAEPDRAGRQLRPMNISSLQQRFSMIRLSLPLPLLLASAGRVAQAPATPAARSGQAGATGLLLQLPQDRAGPGRPATSTRWRSSRSRSSSTSVPGRRSCASTRRR